MEDRNADKEWFLEIEFFNQRYHVVTKAEYLEYCLLKVRKRIPLHLQIVLALHKQRADLSGLVLELVMSTWPKMPRTP
jgi:hypothetical protein